MAIFEAESYDKIFQVFADPQYEQVVFPDEKKILDRSRSNVFAGEFTTLWDRSRQPDVGQLKLSSM